MPTRARGTLGTTKRSYNSDNLRLVITGILLSFYFHRIVIVTSDNVYIYRDLPFHIPGRQLAAYRRGPGLVRLGSPNPESGISRFIRRGQLTFHDGTVTFHGFLWIRRVQYIEQEANIPNGA